MDVLDSDEKGWLNREKPAAILKMCSFIGIMIVENWIKMKNKIELSNYIISTDKIEPWSEPWKSTATSMRET